MPNILDYLPLLRLQLFLTEGCFCNVIKWSKASRRFIPRPWRHPSSIIPWLIYIAHLCLVLARTRRLLQLGESCILSDIISICMTGVYFWSGMPLLVSSLRLAPELAAMYNGLILYDTRGAKGKRSAETFPAFLRALIRTAKEITPSLLRGDTGRYILQMGILTVTLTPALLTVVVLTQPCSMPIFVRSAVQDCAFPRENLPWNAYIPVGFGPLVSVLDVFLAYYAYGVGVIAVVIIFHCPTTCVLDHLKRLAETSFDSSSPNTDGSKRVVESAILEYRNIRIFSTACNDINQGGNLPLNFTTTTWSRVLMLYAVIALHPILSTGALVFAALLALDCAILGPLLVYEVGGRVNEASANLLGDWGQAETLQKDKYLHRMWKSCGPIKIKIGSSGNFLERTTPLVIFQLTMDQVVSLLLIR